MTNRFRQALFGDELIVFDGAMGTLLFEHGVFINRCFDELNLTNPDLIREIHAQYIESGAAVIETNTFGANQYKLATFGLADRLEEINQRGADLARKAAGENVSIAGSIGPLGVRIEPWGPTSLEETRAAFRRQVDALILGGVDLIILETFTDLAEIGQALAAVNDARKAEDLDLPVIASMTVNRSGDSLYGTAPEIFGPKLENWGADIVGLNCSVGPRPMLDTLERLRGVTTVPLSIMPNAGEPTEVEGRTLYLCSPDYMANYARRFVDIGARVVGGCCGTTPEHIRAIATSLRQISGEQRSLRAAQPKSAPDASEIAPKPPIPVEERSILAGKITRGEFVASVEIAPPQGWNLRRIVKNARAVKEAGFDAINIPDGPRATARMGPLAMATVLEREVELETIMHYACRDRNLVGMQSDLLGAYALSLRNILVITGDPPIMGDYPQATAVFDVDSIGLTNMLTRLNQGFDLGGRSIGSPTGFFVLVGLNPTAINPDKERSRFHWKVDAGAKAAITQPVFDAEQLLRFLDLLAPEDTIPVVAGIWPLQSVRNAEFLANEVPGVSIPKDVIRRMEKARERDEERLEGEKIAVEIFEKVHHRVGGIQVAAPFGRIDSAIRVLDSVRRIKDKNAK